MEQELLLSSGASSPYGLAFKRGLHLHVRKYGSSMVCFGVLSLPFFLMDVFMLKLYKNMISFFLRHQKGSNHLF